MKKTKLLYPIYSLLIIVSLALFLVFNAKGQDETVGNETVYASEIMLNCPRSINVPLNSTFQFESNFLTVTPAEAKVNLKCEISAKTGSDIQGLTLNGNTFYADKEGIYNLKFSLPNSENKSIYENVVVNVVDENVISLNIETLKVDEEQNILDVFNVETDAEIQVEVDDSMIEYSNNTFTPISNGSTTIKVYATKNYITLAAQYEINILPADFYNIRIQNIVLNNLFCTIEYEILNNSETNVYQDITIEIDNPNVQLINDSSPFLTFRAEKDCIANITLYLTNEEDSKITLQIEFKNE